MRAVQYSRYGAADVLTIENVDSPTPAGTGVVIDVIAAALNPKDVLIRKGKFRVVAPGRFPRCCGYDFSGVEVKTGREVFGMVNGMLGRTCAERIVVGPDELSTKPDSIDHHGAASLPLAGQTALQALRDDGVLGSGQHAIINGASGGVGTLAIQIAKALGADVTAVCSAKNRELCLSLGADVVHAYDECDPLQVSETADVFFDVFGNRSLSETKHLLAKKGTYVSTLPNRRVVLEVARSVLRSKRAKLVVVRSKRADLETLAGLVIDEKLRPVIDQTFSLDEIQDAHRRVETRRARGKVTIGVRPA